MAVPSYVPGQVLTAADCSLWFTPIAAVTTGDQSVNTSTAFLNDNTLALAVAASSTYEVKLHGVFDGPASSSVIWQFTGPSGSSGSFGQLAPSIAGASTGTLEVPLAPGGLTGANFTETTGAGTNLVLDVIGTFVTGANAGTLQLQWAPGSSSATNTRRRKNSSLVIRRIS